MSNLHWLVVVVGAIAILLGFLALTQQGGHDDVDTLPYAIPLILGGAGLAFAALLGGLRPTSRSPVVTAGAITAALLGVGAVAMLAVFIGT